MTITDAAAFIEALLADLEFRREIEEEHQWKWETFTLRLLAVEAGESYQTSKRSQRIRPSTVSPAQTSSKRSSSSGFLATTPS